MRQQEFIGPGSIKKLPLVLKRYRARKIFLVTGKNSYTTSQAAFVIEPLLKNYDIVHFDDITPNPTLENIRKGITVFKKANPDIVVAVGGGSIIDTAKLVTILAAQSGAPCDYATGIKKISRKGKPVIAIPTTSGSGSEATHFAVVYINKKKYSVAHPWILPSTAIVDPTFTYTLPSYITATTGIDALAQAIESYWAVNATTTSRAYARAAIPLIFCNLAAAVKKNDKKSRIALSKGAHLSGKAINISKTTAAHALSYPLTAYHDIPHGHAVGILLPWILAYNDGVTTDDVTHKRGARFVHQSLRDIYKLLGAKNAVDAQRVIINLAHQVGLQTCLVNFGIKPSEFTRFAALVSDERAGNNPRRFTKKDALQILTNAL